MATFAVVARFNKDANDILQHYKDELKKILSYDEAGGLFPHMTLGIYEAVDCCEICEWTKQYAGKKSKFKIEFDSIGLFLGDGEQRNTDVIYAAPTIPPALSGFYYGYHEKLDELNGELGRQYSMLIGQPTFHSTITICKTDEFNIAMDYLRMNFKPFKATIESIEVYEIPNKFVMRFELQN